MTPVDPAPDIRIDRGFDSALTAQEHAELHELLREAFGGYFKDRAFFKQIPHERLLLRTPAGIAGQCGLDYRVMRAGHELIYTLGAVDLCVRQPLRGRGLGERLMRAMLAVAAERRVDHAILVAQDPGCTGSSAFCRCAPR
jgi:GNAT superfamily N-acetyltransferase